MAPTTQTPATGQAIIYCRVSTKGQEEHGTSLDSQEREGVAHAATLGYSVGRITREVYSGAELWDRPKLSRDRRDLKSGAFAALICYSTDRLSRDPIHLAILAEECERAGVALHFVSETFDDSDEAALIRYVKGYSNKKEREKIRERFLRGKYQRALNGKIHNMGPEKYGWRRDKAAGVRMLYEREAQVIRRIFTLVALEGRSYYSIGRLLSAEGVLAPGAARFPDRKVQWKADAIMRIIRDPAYKGEGEAWKWKRAGRSSSGQSARVILRPAEERVPLPAGVVPAIVDADLWQRAQEAVAAQSGNHTRNERLPYLLRGLIYCPVCARKLYPAWHRKTGGAPAGSPTRRVYRCASQAAPNVPCGARIVNAEKIEAWAWAKVLDALDHPEVLAAERERQQQEGPDLLLTD